jgi:hypothetical protein
LVALGLLLVPALALVPTARAPFQGLDLTPSEFTGTNVYVPGETLQWSVQAGAGETYDIVIVSEVAGRVTLRAWDDAVIPESGVLVDTFLIQENLPDSSAYAVEVWTDGFLEANPAFLLARHGFSVQEYTFAIETDRSAYLGGDTVTIIWTANRLKDGSLADAGVGQIWVYNDDGEALIDNPFVFSEPSGTFAFDLAPLSDPDVDAWVFGWFNDSLTQPIRAQSSVAFFDVDFLGVIVDVTPSVNVPGGIVTVDVRTVVTDDQTNPRFFDPPQPDVLIDIVVRNQDTGVRQADYEVTALQTDAQGRLTHIFQLETSIAEGTVFEVEALATANGVWSWQDRDTFEVRARAGLSVNLLLDRQAYASGDTLQATAEVVFAGGEAPTFTYIFEVRNGGPGGTLLARNTTTDAVFTFAIEDAFAGILYVRVQVFDGLGNTATAAVTVSVEFGLLLVNVTPQQYLPGDTLRATYSLRSGVITDPTYYYEIRDASGGVVSSGEATGGTVEYAVPEIPSTRYTVEVMASQDGRVVSGQATVRLLSGYVLSISFDRSAYAPGETMVVSYRIVALGDSLLPPTFALSFGVLGSPMKTLVTDQPTGTFTYRVPEGVNEGDLLFFVTEFNTFAQASEVVTVRPTNPAWFTTIADVPVFSWLLLVLVVLLFLLLLMTRRSLGLSLPKLREERPSPPPEEEARPTTVMGPMQIACGQCGATIDITTSKRPIEVMCPSCGNTEMVE